MEKFDRLLEVVTGLADGVGKLADQRTSVKVSEPR